MSLKRSLNSGLVTLAVMLGAFMPLANAASTTQNNICGGAELELNAANCDNSTKDSASTIENLIKDVVNILSMIVGIVAVIMIIYGGFRYITSGGDSGNIGTAKNIIIYSLIGLIIAALAQVIVRFVLGEVT